MTEGLYRLMAWLSPNFPTGAFGYSHGLEAAAESGLVHDRASLAAWVAAIVEYGSGRIDADILCNAYRAASAGAAPALVEANRRGAAYRATAELALESTQQGGAFRVGLVQGWPGALDGEFCPRSDPPAAGKGVRRASGGRVRVALRADVCYPAVFGAAATRAGIALGDALIGYLQAFAGNLIAAGLRLGIVGQTDGQGIQAALEPVVARAAAAAMARDPEDFGSATFAADLMSIAHETQYSRLFRS
jgi:urease accessory protein